MKKLLLVFSILLINTSAFAGEPCFEDDKECNAQLPDELDLLAFEGTPSPFRKIRTVRLQANSNRSNCIGASSRDSNVGMWSCTESAGRYDWDIWESSNPNFFYLVNHLYANDHDNNSNRCLSRQSSSNRLRNYEFKGNICAASYFRIWKILDADGNRLDADDIRFNMPSEIQLVNVQMEQCVGGSSGSPVRLYPCERSAFQIFTVHPAGPIN